MCWSRGRHQPRDSEVRGLDTGRLVPGMFNPCWNWDMFSYPVPQRQPGLGPFAGIPSTDGIWRGRCRFSSVPDALCCSVQRIWLPSWLGAWAMPNWIPPRHLLTVSLAVFEDAITCCWQSRWLLSLKILTQRLGLEHRLLVWDRSLGRLAQGSIQLALLH